MTCSESNGSARLIVTMCVIDNRSLPSDSAVTDRSLYTVAFARDGDKVTEIDASVEQPSALTPSDDVVDGFFGGTVGGTWPAPTSTALTTFVHERLRSGGSAVVGTIRVSISGPPDHRTMRITAAP